MHNQFHLQCPVMRRDPERDLQSWFRPAKPETRNPKPTLKTWLPEDRPKPETRNPKPTIKVGFKLRNPKPETRNPKPTLKTCSGWSNQKTSGDGRDEDATLSAGWKMSDSCKLLFAICGAVSGQFSSRFLSPFFFSFLVHDKSIFNGGHS